MKINKTEVKRAVLNVGLARVNLHYEEHKLTIDLLQTAPFGWVSITLNDEQRLELIEALTEIGKR